MIYLCAYVIKRYLKLNLTLSPDGSVDNASVTKRAVGVVDFIRVATVMRTRSI